MEISQAAPPAGAMHICPLCRKPFLNELSYSRHTGYCRRARNRPRARVRSCRACSLAKAKCSFHPQCLRCTRKGIECSYENAPAPPKEPVASKPSVPVSTPGFPTDIPSSANFNLNDLFTEGAIVDPGDSQTTVDWSTIGEPSNDIFLPSVNNKLPDFADPSTKMMPSTRLLLDNNPNNRHGVEELLANLDREEFSLTESPESVWSNNRDDYLVPHSGPPVTVQRQDSDFLTRLPARHPNSHFAGSMIMQMLRAFPEMMVRRETFPSFVHPHWCNDASELPLPEPLVNCMGIAQVFASHNPQNKSYLWRAIKFEQRSFKEKLEQGLFSEEDLLAAVQAQIMYIIMRTIDNSKFERDLNTELLHTHYTLCESFRKLLNQPFCQDERLVPSSSWEAWIFAESRRRTVLVWFLIASMFRTKTNTPCEVMDRFRVLPLPAPKALWDARTRLGWQSEYEVYRFMPRSGLDVLGDLLDAYKQSEEGSDAGRLKVDSWTAKVDQLGLMLSIGVAMV